MDINNIIDTRIESLQILLSPIELIQLLPLTESAAITVMDGRLAIANILEGKDHRKIIVVGPCSIHDIKAAEEYAAKLKALADRVRDRLLLVMRVYFEKPRTTVGWKGLINDPFLDGSFNLEKGLFTARRLLIHIAELGLPVATEALDPIILQYISDLISWFAIGARTIESQTHREMASGLSVPLGFKNSTDGNIKVAMNAIQASRFPHHFLGINQMGQISILKTKGNPYSHIILRGGNNKPNFDAETVKWVEEKLAELNLYQNIMIDCSHDNSKKDYTQQGAVFKNVLQQIVGGNTSIIGLMLESNLYEGNQQIFDELSRLKYGVSITDECIGWEETEELILGAYYALTSDSSSSKNRIKGAIRPEATLLKKFG